MTASPMVISLRLVAKAVMTGGDSVALGVTSNDVADGVGDGAEDSIPEAVTVGGAGIGTNAGAVTVGAGVALAVGTGVHVAVAGGATSTLAVGVGIHVAVAGVATSTLAMGVGVAVWVAVLVAVGAAQMALKAISGGGWAASTVPALHTQPSSAPGATTVLAAPRLE